MLVRLTPRSSALRRFYERFATTFEECESVPPKLYNRVQS